MSVSNNAAKPGKPTLRALVVGYGGMGKDWCSLLLNHPNVELAGVVEIRAEARARAAAEQDLPSTAVYDRLAAAIVKTDADFIIDCSPPSEHKNNTLMALAHGVHVMGEHPMALALSDADEVVAAARAAGKIYMVNQNYRWHPMVRALREFMKGGTLGPLQTVHVLYAQHVSFSDTFRYQMSHPLLHDMAAHHFDMLRYTTGNDAVSVYSVESRPAHTPFKGGSAVSAVCTLADGSVFTYQGSWSDTGRPTDVMGKWRIVCDRGVIAWNGTELPMLEGETLTDDERHAFILRMAGAAEGNGHTFYGQLRASLDSFVTAVHHGAQPETQGSDNIRTLAMVLGAIESSDSGQLAQI